MLKIQRDRAPLLYKERGWGEVGCICCYCNIFVPILFIIPNINILELLVIQNFVLMTVIMANF